MGGTVREVEVWGFGCSREAGTWEEQDCLGAGWTHTLAEQCVDFLLVDVQVIKGALQQIVRGKQTADITDCRLEQTDAQTRAGPSYGIDLCEIDGGNEVQDLVHDVGLLHDDGRVETVDGRDAPSVTAIVPRAGHREEMVVGEGDGVVAFPGETEHLDDGIGALRLVGLEAGVVVVFAFLAWVRFVGIVGAAVAYREGVGEWCEARAQKQGLKK